MKIIFVTLSNFGQFNIIFSIANELSKKINNEEILFITGDNKKEIIEKNKKIKFISIGKMETINNINPEMIYKKPADMFTESEVLFKYLLSEDVYEDPYNQMIKFMEKKIFNITDCLMIIDVITFFALDFANKYNIPYIVTCPVDPSGFFTSSLNWSYPSIFDPYDSSFLNIIKNKIEIKLYIIYNILFRKLGNTRFKLTGSFESPENLLRKSEAIICTNIWGPVEPFDHPHNLHMVGTILEGNTYMDNTDLIKWINKDSRNVILVCFGTIATLTPDIINNLRMAFINITNNYNIKILWKLKNNDIKFTDNIKVIDWIPSIKEILDNEKIILNIHHGGANSFQEALYYGVRQLIIPFWSDCYGIARRAVEIGVALTVKDSRNFDHKEIENNIETLLDDNKFEKKCNYFKNKCRKTKGLEKSVKIIENVLDDLKYKV